MAATQIAAEALHEDVLQGAAADQPQRIARRIDDRQGEEGLVLRGQQAIRDIRDAHPRRQRRDRFEQARQSAGSGHWQALSGSGKPPFKQRQVAIV
ncbi:hypothetical protein D9M68_863490 [compost metagenome]